MRTCGPAQRAGRLREGEVFVSSVVSWGHPSKTLAERSRPSLLPTASPEVGRVVLEGEGADEARIAVRRQKGASWRDDVCPVGAPLLSAVSGLRDRSAPSLLGLWSLSERMSRAGGWAWADGGSVVRSPSEEFCAIGGLARGEIGILRHLGRRRAVGVGSLVLSWREAPPKSAWRGPLGRSVVQQGGVPMACCDLRLTRFAKQGALSRQLVRR